MGDGVLHGRHRGASNLRNDFNDVLQRSRFDCDGSIFPELKHLL
jgi:hypothetical protein